MQHRKKYTSQNNTSWQKVHSWYDEIVGDRGHYYHKAIILPKTLLLLNLQKDSSLLDIACGQGVLARTIPPGTQYVGIDSSKNLIKVAAASKRAGQEFFVADATQPLPLQKRLFTHATIILALQNIKEPKAALCHARQHLVKGGRLVIVINHPCFRIPRQSHWGVDDKTKTQYRRMDVYMSPQTIPIDTHPGKNEKDDATLSFHYPLSTYCNWLREAGFCLDTIDEWCSDKTSTGANARMENRARKEFPLFLAISAIVS